MVLEAERRARSVMGGDVDAFKPTTGITIRDIHRPGDRLDGRHDWFGYSLRCADWAMRTPGLLAQWPAMAESRTIPGKHSSEQPPRSAVLTAFPRTTRSGGVGATSAPPDGLAGRQRAIEEMP